MPENLKTFYSTVFSKNILMKVYTLKIQTCFGGFTAVLKKSFWRKDENFATVQYFLHCPIKIVMISESNRIYVSFVSLPSVILKQYGKPISLVYLLFIRCSLFDLCGKRQMAGIF